MLFLGFLVSLVTDLRVSSLVRRGVTVSRLDDFLKMAYSTLNPPSSLDILLVDDNEGNLLVTAAILKNGGFCTEECTSGIEAVEAAKRKKYDFIFMDCAMPQMDGFEAARLIRNHAESLNCDTPIVALTANLSRFGGSRCIESGMTDFMSKPARSEELEAKLEQWIRSKENGSLLDSDLPVFDKTYICSIYGDDMDGIEELIQEFKNVLEVNYTELCLALNEAPDIENLRKLTHGMKGTTRTIGAERLGSIMTKMEEACIAGNQALVASYEATFHSEYGSLAKALEVG